MFRTDRLVKAAGLGFLILAVTHIPDGLFRYGFDKNASAQFTVLLLGASLMGVFILLRANRFHFPRAIKLGLVGLIVALGMSTAFSGNIYGSITGDTGRYAGVLTLLGLVVVAIFHSQFDFRQFNKLIQFYLAAVFAVVVIGILQHYNVIEMPGTDQMPATLGNLDFFAAFVGTSLPLYFFRWIQAERKERIILAIVVAINIFSLDLAGARQGWLDLAFAVLGIGIYLLRKWIPRRDMTVNVRTFLGTFAVIIWAEFIFLFPFLGKSVPVLGDDIQVEIRSNFWLSATRQFFSHPFFGVGPDQYGNNYEQYRTLADARDYANILSNDAHSASVQTLATLGIAGTLALLFFFVVLIRSLILLWDYKPEVRRQLFALVLYFFIYSTNSFISPITIPNKYLFWATAGFVVGQIYRSQRESNRRSNLTVKVSVVAVAISSIFVSSNFVFAQYKYLSATDEFASTKNARVGYEFSPFIPCVMYFDEQLKMVSPEGNEAAKELGLKQIEVSPRCISARIL